jgi:hypothetical protein
MRSLVCGMLLAGCSFRVPGVDVPVTPTAGQEAGPALSDAAVVIVDASMRPTAPLDMMGPLLTPDMSKPLPPPENVGDTCAGACGGGLTCMSWGLAGYCTKTCGMCPPGSRCADVGGDLRYCLLETAPGGACDRNDLVCRDCGGQVCAPANFCDGC